MKLLSSMLLGGLLALALPGGASAVAGANDRPAQGEGAKAPAAAKAHASPATGKEVTLKGTFGCAKCSFREADACRNVLKVKEGGKQVTYEVASNEIAKQHHEEICHNAGKPASIEGTVSEEGGKKTVTPTAIKLLSAP